MYLCYWGMYHFSVFSIMNPSKPSKTIANSENWKLDLWSNQREYDFNTLLPLEGLPSGDCRYSSAGTMSTCWWNRSKWKGESVFTKFQCFIAALYTLFQFTSCFFLSTVLGYKKFTHFNGSLLCLTLVIVLRLKLSYCFYF